MKISVRDSCRATGFTIVVVDVGVVQSLDWVAAVECEHFFSQVVVGKQIIASGFTFQLRVTANFGDDFEVACLTTCDMIIFE